MQSWRGGGELHTKMKGEGFLCQNLHLPLAYLYVTMHDTAEGC